MTDKTNQRGVITLMCCDQEMKCHGFWPHPVHLDIQLIRYACDSCESAIKVISDAL